MRNDYLAEFNFVKIGLDELVDANLRSVLPETKACRLLVRLLRIAKYRFNRRNVLSLGKQKHV